MVYGTSHGDMKNPWEILGIPRGSSVEEIKVQYRKLALRLHPDKHDVNLNPKEKKQLEERFKEVSVAYQIAINITTRSKEHGCDWNSYENSDKWWHMWESVEHMVRNQNFMNVLGTVVKDTLKDMATAYVNKPASSDISSDVDSETDTETDSNNECTKEDDTPRIFKLMVSMEEVHSKKSRKVRLFLSEFPKDPFYVDVDFDHFPEMIYHHRHNGISYKIIIEMKLKPHQMYYWDNLLGGWDLYTTVPISLTEYFMGSLRKLYYIDTAKTTIDVDIPTFPNMKETIIYEGLGLRGKGNLYVILEIRLPCKRTWENIKKENESIIFQNFLNVCKKLENTDAPDDVSS